MATSSPPFWEDLLAYIDDRRVIPVVGAELLRIPGEDSGGDIPFYAVLARRLAARLGVTADDLPEDDDALHAVVCRHIKAKGPGRRQELYTRLHAALGEVKDAVPVPVALRTLAAVRHFDLFVSTTFDSLLARAIDEERFGGRPKTQSIAYAPNDVQDLPDAAEPSGRPTVYHLLGRSSVAPDYAVTEEDVLEFFHALQSDERRPKQLFKELRKKHLLLIGNRFPDWLARFFLRLTRQDRLSGQRDSIEYVADRNTCGAENPLVVFLKNFSQAEIYEGGAVDFVADLAERYAARHGPGQSAAVELPPTVTGPARNAPVPGSVFLSYAREDLAAVRQMHDALESAGIDAWMELRELEAGDHFAEQIRRNIKSCSLFVPVISGNTQARLEGWFRREWRWAAARSEDFAGGVPFILPACIDETPEADALVPPEFLDVQWTRLPGGRVTGEFAARMVRLVREYRKRQQRGPT